MSKNIYRVNKKSDLDEIMKNNFFKPVCIVFLSKSADPKLFIDIVSSILAISKQHTYNMIILIDFDDFLDNNGFFDSIKLKLPFFLSFFKGKNITSIDNKDNFIPLVINKMEEIHKSYLNRLIHAFNQSNDDIEQPNNNNPQINETLNNNKDSNTQQTDIKKNIENDNKSVSSKSSESSRSSKSSKSSTSSEKSTKSEKSKITETKSLMSDDTEKIVNKKEKLKKLKQLQKLQSMLNK